MANNNYSRMTNVNRSGNTGYKNTGNSYGAYQSNTGRPQYSRDTIDDGSAVRKATIEFQNAPEQRRQIQIITESEPSVKVKMGRGIDFVSMSILAVAIIATLYICIQYLQIKSDIVQLEKLVAGAQSDVAAVQKENDALAASMDAYAYDLDDIYKFAVGKLGMVYPNKNDVFYYNNDDSSYYRQYNTIPKK